MTPNEYQKEALRTASGMSKEYPRILNGLMGLNGEAGKRVFGAVMSAAEKKAMDMEIQRQLAEYDRKHIREIDALVLWELREQLGFGNKRLKKFYDNFSRGIEALIRRYEMEQGDDVWLCTYKLKEIGCDLEKWEKERGDQ